MPRGMNIKTSNVEFRDISLAVKLCRKLGCSVLCFKVKYKGYMQSYSVQRKNKIYLLSLHFICLPIFGWRVRSFPGESISSEKETRESKIVMFPLTLFFPSLSSHQLGSGESAPWILCSANISYYLYKTGEKALILEVITMTEIMATS